MGNTSRRQQGDCEEEAVPTNTAQLHAMTSVWATVPVTGSSSGYRSCGDQQRVFRRCQTRRALKFRTRRPDGGMANAALFDRETVDSLCRSNLDCSVVEVADPSRSLSRYDRVAKCSFLEGTPEVWSSASPSPCSLRHSSLLESGGRYALLHRLLHRSHEGQSPPAGAMHYDGNIRINGPRRPPFRNVMKSKQPKRGLFISTVSPSVKCKTFSQLEN